ncbi:bifunctional phosphopantothenoylcysteine decarboxylase/phosphopantothenate--cysteine ligase CoaBC [Marinicrinis lubricantis]|uniref:Coenzyme A biosynthesis bifunctional protein CoaBC n=1 Tax=Marinicrinis lubricantis TaxID=2086470 RepID=A0ABW1IMN4_9BACL
MLKGKRIIVGVSGGIASYKAITLCSLLYKAGADVKVILTESATKFVTPLTFQTIARGNVYTDTFEERDPKVIAHIDVADHADLVIVAPATANIIAKMAHGLADDMLSTTLLATTAPILLSPAMNVHMLAHPAVQHNLRLLSERGVQVIDPAEGQLACGYTGKGRLPEPEQLLQAIESYFSQHLLLRGRKVLITAGGTRERLDPVRYLGNDSSGKMGFALAEAAVQMGAEVTLIAAASSLPVPAGVHLVRVESAQEMYGQVMQHFDQTDYVFKAAAVADYRPVVREMKKRKKGSERWVIELERTTDILETIGKQKQHQFVVGFAAETEALEHYAMDKLRRKNCDLVVANDVSQEGAGFNSDTNIVSIYGEEGCVLSLPMMSKLEVARQLLKLAMIRKGDQGGGAHVR